MVQYATAEELAGYLQQDLDTYTANLVLTLASGAFRRAADTAFTSVSETWATTGTPATAIILPFNKITAVSAVRLNSVAITGSTLRGRVLYRAAGFGTAATNPPDLLEVDLTHGYATTPDDVKAAVLETAASTYRRPANVLAGESIDDYSVRYAAEAGGVQLTTTARALADSYRGLLAA